MDEDKFCLQWNEFEANITSGFQDLREEKDFFDVTLACEDEQISAHKVILSACSPFFRTILRRNSHPHPLLYMKGVKFTELESILYFMYHGRVNIAQEDLTNFLSVAEDLKVKGLTQNNPGSKSVSSGKPPSNDTFPLLKQKLSEPNVRRTNKPSSAGVRTPAPAPFPVEEDVQEVFPIIDHDSIKTELQMEGEGDFTQVEEEGYEDSTILEEGTEHVVISNGQSELAAPANFDQHNHFDHFDQYMSKVGGGTFSCNICPYVKTKTLVRNHVESIHYPNTFTYTCPICGKAYGTNNSYVCHKKRAHKGE